MRNLMKNQDDSWGILGLQNCILNIAKYFDEFCEERGIDYCLMGGSALGAIRHKGFIPWDDDLDVFMRPDEFEKFRTAFKKEGDTTSYYLQEWGGNSEHVTFAKLRLNCSYYQESVFDNHDIHKGVFIDIFILHNCPDSMIGHLWQYFWSRYLVLKSLANRNYKRHGRLGNLILKPLKWLPKRAFVDYAIKQIYKSNAKKTKYYCHYLGRAGYSKGLYRSEYFKYSKRVPFENITLRVPGRVEDYVTERWGDYMKIPSKEEIAYFQHSSNWSVSKPFDGFNVENKYSDEVNLIS